MHPEPSIFLLIIFFFLQVLQGESASMAKFCYLNYDHLYCFLIGPTVTTGPETKAMNYPTLNKMDEFILWF